MCSFAFLRYLTPTFFLGVLLTVSSVFASELLVVELNCSSLGKMRIREATPNEDIRSPLSDFLILTLPSGIEIKLIGSAGASVRNWTSPSAGVTFSQAPTWSNERITFESDSYGYKKGVYVCSSVW